MAGKTRPCEICMKPIDLGAIACLCRSGVPEQRFCCQECRQALRRVLDREARWRQRRRRRWSKWHSGPVRPT